MDAVIFVGTDTIERRGGAILLADTIVGGLTLLQRAMRCAQLAGAERIIVITPDPDAARKLASADEVLEAAIETLGSRRPLEEAGGALLEYREQLPERFWLTTADRLLSPHHFPRPSGNRLMAVVDGRGADVGTFVITRAELSLVAACGEAPLVPTADADTHPVPDAAWFQIRSGSDVRPATSALLRTLRKPLARNADGLAAYFINRPISLRLSRLVVGTPVTPNQITTLMLFLGLAAAALVSTGRWGWMVLGAITLQLSSILDGVDGEVARMRLTTSRAGEWYDTVSDDVISTAFTVGLGFAAYRQSGTGFYLVATVVAAAAAILLSLLRYGQLIQHGVASHNDIQWGYERGGNSRRGRLVRPLLVALGYLTKRDSHTIVLLSLLVLNQPEIAFGLIAVGTLAILAGVVIQHLAWARQRRHRA